MTMEGAQGSRLFRARQNDTNNATVFTASLPTEITRILVANTTGSAATFRLFHVAVGGTADQTSALYYDVSVPANTTFAFGGDTNNGGIHLEEGETIVFREGTANALTIHGYGVTASVAPEVLNNG